MYRRPPRIVTRTSRSETNNNSEYHKVSYV